MPSFPVDPDAPTVADDPFLGEGFLIETLSALIGARSVNPGFAFGRGREGDGFYETECARAVADLLEPTGAEISVVEFAPGRPSVAAVIRGHRDEPRLVLNGHMDTVPVDDHTLWTTDPFTATVRNGHVYGRGACDMKGGLAVQISVAHHIARFADSLKGTLVLHFAAGEETGEPGTLSLLEAGFGGDVGITTEPTQLRVATATRGAAVFRIRIHGRSTHASRARAGLNPLERLPAVLAMIADYDRQLEGRPHALLPGGSCTPTIVQAGVKENAVPDFCDVTIDRRILPGEDVTLELAELQRRLGLIAADDPSYTYDIALSHGVAGAEIDPASSFATLVMSSVEAVTGRAADAWGAPFGSDVQILVNEGGVEAVTFGPGNVEMAHSPDERVPIEELCAASRVIVHVARDLLF